jgi:endonuclease YncB( thermonuclease family)
LPHLPEIRARTLSFVPAAAGRIAAAFLLLLAEAILAADLHGTVIVVPDGDSLVVVDADRRQHRVRLAAIDAPEKGQPFANRSRDHLARWVLDRTVRVRWYKRDEYERLVGTVLLNETDVNLEQLRAGYAWWYRQYAHEQSSVARRDYERAEREARRTRRGLWADERPVPPWHWRRSAAVG